MLSLRKLALLPALLAACLSATASADDTVGVLLKRLDELEKRLHELESKTASDPTLAPEVPATPAAAPDQPPNTDASGFTLQSLILAGSERLEISGSIRLRGEYKDNVTDFAKGRSDGQEFILSRVRLRFDFHVLEDLDAVVEIQDSRQFGDEGTPVSTARELEATDLSLGYIEARNLLVEGLGVRAGRQILSFGDERLVGAFDYNNFSNRFDALSVFYRLAGDRPAEAGPYAAKPPDLVFAQAFLAILDETNLASDDAIFTGIDARFQPVEPLSASIYYFYLDDMDEDATRGEDGLFGNRQIHTFGSLWKFALAGFSVSSEGALQFGDHAHDDLEAFAFAGEVAYQLKDVPWKPKLGAGFAWASGDDDPDDGRRGTFENLFPTNHLFYGVMDLFSWQNLEDLWVRADVFPVEGLSIWVAYHFFRLDENDDFWYDAARVPIRPNASPRTSAQHASKTVGHEIDLSVRYVVNRNFSFLLQYGHFFAGPYVEDTGLHSDADFVALTAQLDF